MTTSIERKVSEAMRVLDEADADLATMVDLSASLADSQAELMRVMLEKQQAMQEESRKIVALSNIMKTKHDTVKNSISNVR